MIGFYNPGSGVMEKTQQKTLGSTIAGNNEPSQAVKYELEIIGAGSDGIMSIRPKSLDFGTITVGFSKTLSVVVVNKSNCNLYVELKMSQKIEEDTKERRPEIP